MIKALAAALFATFLPLPALAELAARDIASSVGITYPNMFSEGETPTLDLDGDGRLDVIINSHARRPQSGGRTLGDWPVLRWNGSTFVAFDLLEDRLTMDRHGCVAADFGRQGATASARLPDGVTDLYCIHGARLGRCGTPMPGDGTPAGATCQYWSNELFLRNDNRTFPPATEAATSHARAWGWRRPTIAAGTRPRWTSIATG